jgi:hypothetical protein
MTPLSDRRVLQLLRAELPALRDQRPATDLWPRLQTRVHQGLAPSPSPVDWMLLALVVISCALRPSAIGMLLFHF